MSSLEVYLITKIDTVIGLLQVFLFVMLATGIISVVNKDEIKNKFLKSNGKKLIVISVILYVLSCFVPSSRQILAMYAIPKITNSKSIKILDQIMSNQFKKNLEIQKQEDNK